jgi:hypothetical protein
MIRLCVCIHAHTHTHKHTHKHTHIGTIVDMSGRTLSGQTTEGVSVFVLLSCKGVNIWYFCTSKASKLTCLGELSLREPPKLSGSLSRTPRYFRLHSFALVCFTCTARRKVHILTQKRYGTQFTCVVPTKVHILTQSRTRTQFTCVARTKVHILTLFCTRSPCA